MAHSSRRALPHDRTAPAAARELARAAVDGQGCIDDVELVASELAANAVRHGAGANELRITVERATVLVEVTHDAGATRPVLRAVEPGSSGGHGLQIVTALAAEWGWDEDGTRLRVWAVIPTERSHD